MESTLSVSCKYFVAMLKFSRDSRNKWLFLVIAAVLGVVFLGLLSEQDNIAVNFKYLHSINNTIHGFENQKQIQSLI